MNKFDSQTLFSALIGANLIILYSSIPQTNKFTCRSSFLQKLFAEPNFCGLIGIHPFEQTSWQKFKNKILHKRKSFYSWLSLVFASVFASSFISNPHLSLSLSLLSCITTNWTVQLLQYILALCPSHTTLLPEYMPVWIIELKWCCNLFGGFRSETHYKSLQQRQHRSSAFLASNFFNEGTRKAMNLNSWIQNICQFAV